MANRPQRGRELEAPLGSAPGRAEAGLTSARSMVATERLDEPTKSDIVIT